MMLKKGLKFVSFNIRSLYPSIEEVQYKMKHFAVIGICETWLNSTYSNTLVEIENFSMYRLDRESGNILNQKKNTKRGGGLQWLCQKIL